MNSDTVDLAELRQRLDDDKELFLDISEFFFADFHSHVEAIRQAIQDNSTIAVVEHAHAIKGALANLSVKRAVQFAFQLEVAGKNNNLSEAGAVLTSLNNEVENFRKFVEEVKTGIIWNP